MDATAYWAGPAAGQLLGFLGAEVWHLESIQRPDGARYQVGPLADRDQWWELGSLWISTNSNKRSLTLDLSDKSGQEIFRDLVSTCDVLIENFSPRVFESFGLDASGVRQMSPDIVYCRMPAFGLDGPWRDGVGFAQTMEQISGMAWVTGHADDQPRIPRGPCDPVAGYHAAFAVLAALLERARTGRGCDIEVAMVEASLAVAAEVVIAHTTENRDSRRMGNRDLLAVPQGVYQCAGGEWLALSVMDDSQWLALSTALGFSLPLRTRAERLAAQDELDVVISDWVGGLSLSEVRERLVALGVPVEELRDPRTIRSDPRLLTFGYFEGVEHPIAGVMQLPTVPFRFESVPRWTIEPPPLLGQHTEEILGDVLGFEPDRLLDLRTRGITGDRPRGLQ
jgi:crotonobetainyl-CoA:carnitine CoA-transferase CaiB-like acyl-CoA transferase